MRRVSRAAAAIAIVLAMAAVFLGPTGQARAFDPRHPIRRQQVDLPPALKNQLSDILSDAVQPYLAAEEEKRDKRQPWVDLQPKFQYLPNANPNGPMVVSCKLGGAEYDPSKGGSQKGAATGRLKYLVFTYSLINGKWAQTAKPKWETQDLGTEAGKKMTAAAARAEKRRAEAAAAAKAKARAEALQKGLNQKTGNAP